MRGEFIGVWSETWRGIWTPLIDRESVPDDIFCELYRELAPALKAPPSVEALADIIDNAVQSREAFEATRTEDIAGERGLVSFLEAAHPALDDLAGDPLANGYFNLLASSTGTACATTCAGPAPCARHSPASSRALSAIFGCLPGRTRTLIS